MRGDRNMKDDINAKKNELTDEQLDSVAGGRMV